MTHSTFTYIKKYDSVCLAVLRNAAVSPERREVATHFQKKNKGVGARGARGAGLVSKKISNEIVSIGGITSAYTIEIS